MKKLYRTISSKKVLYFSLFLFALSLCLASSLLIAALDQNQKKVSMIESAIHIAGQPIQRTAIRNDLPMMPTDTQSTNNQAIIVYQTPVQKKETYPTKQVTVSSDQVFCQTHICVSTFYTDNKGTIVQCADGKWSHSGGEKGACSKNGGLMGIAIATQIPTATSQLVPSPTHVPTQEIIESPTATPSLIPTATMTPSPIPTKVIEPTPTIAPTQQIIQPTPTPTIEIVPTSVITPMVTATATQTK